MTTNFWNVSLWIIRQAQKKLLKFLRSILNRGVQRLRRGKHRSRAEKTERSAGLMANKIYSPKINYEKKLEKVMERLGVADYDYDWTRNDCCIEFYYKGGTLEDLARAVKRRTYDLQIWIQGMKQLPPPVTIPDYIRALGFEEVPASVEDVKARFKSLAKKAHPDGGGTQERFIALQQAADQAIKYVEGE